MADNSAQTGNDSIATDEVTTLNGAASTLVKVQRTKVTFGDDGTSRDVSAAFPLPVVTQASTLAVTATGAASAAVTLTLPAPAAGLFHYIVSLTVQRYASTALTGAAAPVVVTTTNLPGALAFSVDTAGAVGTSTVQTLALASDPLRSTAAATATTVVAPVVTGGIWRLTAIYYTGP